MHYCAEVFENNEALSSTLLKSLKRAMAGGVQPGVVSEGLRRQMQAYSRRDFAKAGTLASASAAYFKTRMGSPKGF